MITIPFDPLLNSRYILSHIASHQYHATLVLCHNHVAKEDHSAFYWLARSGLPLFVQMEPVV